MRSTIQPARQIRKQSAPSCDTSNAIEQPLRLPAAVLLRIFAFLHGASSAAAQGSFVCSRSSAFIVESRGQRVPQERWSLTSEKETAGQCHLYIDKSLLSSYGASASLLEKEKQARIPFFAEISIHTKFSAGK